MPNHQKTVGDDGAQANFPSVGVNFFAMPEKSLHERRKQIKSPLYELENYIERLKSSL